MGKKRFKSNKKRQKREEKRKIFQFLDKEDIPLRETFEKVFEISDSFAFYHNNNLVLT